MENNLLTYVKIEPTTTTYLRANSSQIFIILQSLNVSVCIYPTLVSTISEYKVWVMITLVVERQKIVPNFYFIWEAKNSNLLLFYKTHF